MNKASAGLCMAVPLVRARPLSNPHARAASSATLPPGRSAHGAGALSRAHRVLPRVAPQPLHRRHLALQGAGGLTEDASSRQQCSCSRMVRLVAFVSPYTAQRGWWEAERPYGRKAQRATCSRVCTSPALLPGQAAPGAILQRAGLRGGSPGGHQYHRRIPGDALRCDVLRCAVCPAGHEMPYMPYMQARRDSMVGWHARSGCRWWLRPA